jgi:hypothetical protein
MKRFISLLALSSVAMVAAITGCGSSTGDTGMTGTTTSTTTSTSSSSSSSGMGGGMQHPAPPTLGAQVDRFGRPAINTALNHTFDTDAMAKDLAKNQWNGAEASDKWISLFEGEVEKNLAILDALDGVCGNQLLADTKKNDPSRYQALADVLVDDRLWVNTAATTCTTYLAVEANALGVTNADCGGRALAYDVIDASYTVLAAGKLDGSIGDTIPPDANLASETFPYLAAPNMGM